MNPGEKNQLSRRELGVRVGQAAAVSALAGIAIPAVHAAGAEGTVQIALIGCGGRGSGAAVDAMKAKGVRQKLIAMADAFEDRMKTSFGSLSRNEEVKEKFDVSPQHKYIGFEAYKQAMDVLSPGDVAIFATPLAFRPVMFEYAIKKGLNVFMEKPLSSDGAASRRLLKLAEEASAKNLKVGVGLMSRHARPMQELQKRISDGEIGDIVMMRGYRMHGPDGPSSHAPSPPT